MQLMNRESNRTQRKFSNTGTEAPEKNRKKNISCCITISRKILTEIIGKKKRKSPKTSRERLKTKWGV